MNTDFGPRFRQSDVSWQHRSDMVLHALRHSLPWFVFVNVSFALMVLLRELFFEDIQSTLPARELLPWLDGGMLIVIIAALLLFLVLRHVHAGGTATRWLFGALLCAVSVTWSASIFCFVVIWQLPLGWPLVCVLLLSGLTALYYQPTLLLCYIVPLWLALPLISYQLNHGLNPRFVAVWLIVTGVLIYGHFNL